MGVEDELLPFRQKLLLDEEEGEELDGDREPISEDGSVWQEVCALVNLSIPVAVASVARLLITSTDTAFIGHLGDKSSMLSAASFATTWVGFLTNIVLPPGYVLNSLCSQAIGAGNYKLAGVWLQLSIIISTLLCIPALLGYLNTSWLVNLVVDDEGRAEKVPEYAQQFNYMNMLVLWPMDIFMMARQFFQSAQVVKPAMYVSCMTVGFNLLMNYVFVPEDGPVGWGLIGSPFATFLSMIFQIVIFLSYTVGYREFHKPFWGGWSLDCLQRDRVRRFFAMVLPMTVGVFLENSGLQLITLSTGRIGKENVAANAILASLWTILWGFYWGMGLAMQVRVGMMLGKGKPERAKLVAKLSLAMVFVLCSIVGLVAYAFRTEVAQIYTKHDEVIEIVEDTMYLLVWEYFLGCVALCGVSLLEAMGQNKILAITLSIGMWVIQVPCALSFAYWVPFFKGQEVAGIWLGHICGDVFKILVLWTCIVRLDWDQVCFEAKERSEAVQQVPEADIVLERMLEGEDEDFMEEFAAIDQGLAGHDTQTAEALASTILAANTPLIGTRSPRFVVSIN